ncbi:MAG TPA: DNA methyltransferase [Ignavibacteria bacterium]|nr:DNA methyltransferase [Ignavibacteria bacterium]
MNLNQQKLDVKEKNSSNFFNWRGQFTPQFVEYLLNNFSKKGTRVLDPFSGSGTVLYESAKKDYECYGYEINPAAYAMSKFFTLSNIPLVDRYAILTNLCNKVSPFLKQYGNYPLFDVKDGSNYRQNYKYFLKFSEESLRLNLTPQEKIIFLNILFLSEKDSKLSIKNSINKSILLIERYLNYLPISENKVTAVLKDARCVTNDLEDYIDLIITSPPYINVFNYHQNYRAIVELLNFKVLTIAESEFGSNRKNRSNRFKTIVQYCIDIEQSLKSFWSALNKNGRAILVVGKESNVNKLSFKNGELIRKILKKSNGFSKIKLFERSFINKYGLSIKEEIIVLENKMDFFQVGNAKNISINALKKYLPLINEMDLKTDLIEAIESAEDINPSPILNSKSILNGKNSS